MVGVRRRRADFWAVRRGRKTWRVVKGARRWVLRVSDQMEAVRAAIGEVGKVELGPVPEGRQIREARCSLWVGS